MSWYNWERDCLISAGASRFLKERLFEMSDPYTVMVCDKCGTIIPNQIECKLCKDSKAKKINLPYASKLLFYELQAMGLKIGLIPSE